MHIYLLRFHLLIQTMDSPLLIISIVLLGLAMLFAIKLASFLRYKSQMRNQFPGPTGNPFLGNIMDLVRAGGFNEQFFNQLHSEYGEVAGFWIFGKLNISIANPQHVLAVHKQAPMRPKESKKIIGFLGDESVLLLEDYDEVKVLRRRFVQVLKSAPVLEALLDNTLDCLNTFTSHWEDERVDVHKDLGKVVYEINAKSILGIDWNSKAATQLYSSHVHVLKHFLKWAMVPFPAWYSAGYRQYRKNVKTMWSAAHSIVDKRKSDMENKASFQKDALTMMFSEKSYDQERAFSDKQMATQIIGLLNGSFDTTRATLSWIFQRLGQNPKIQEQLYQEIDQRVQPLGRSYTKEDGNGFPFLDAIILESMRMVPTVPLNQRVNYEEDVTLDPKVVIPKGVTINTPFLPGSRDHDTYNHARYDTGEFCPRRFTGVTEEAKKCNFSHIPFGSGPRYCVGKIYAMIELRIIVTYLLQRFKISLTEEANEVKSVVESGVNQPSESLFIHFTRR